MNAELQNALTEIERMVKTFKAFEQGANAIRALAGYEQNEAEIKGRIELARAAEAELNETLKKAWKDLGDARAQAKTVISTAKTKAAEIAAEAEVKLAQRREEADANLNNTATALAGLEEKYAALENLIASRTLELKATEKRIDDARATIAQLAKL